MESTDLTIQILRDIGEEIHDAKLELGQGLQEVGQEVRDLRQELHETRDELSRRIVESEVRTATAITALAGTVQEMTGVLRAAHDLRPRLERCEQDIADLKRRMS